MTHNPKDVRDAAERVATSWIGKAHSGEHRDNLRAIADGDAEMLRAYATLLDGVNHVLGTCDSDIVAFSKTVDFGDDIRRRCFVEFKRRLVQLLPAPPASSKERGE